MVVKASSKVAYCTPMRCTAIAPASGSITVYGPLVFGVIERIAVTVFPYPA
jgi:hypothetical protein